MPVRPTEDTVELLWSTDINYSGGVDDGTPTKSEPAAGRKAQGWRGNIDGDKPPAQEWNWWMHFNAEWIEWLEAVLTVGHDDDGNHRANVIDTLQIVDGAVETIKIDDLAVTTAKIDNDAVTSAKIATDAVGRDEIAPNSVGRDEEIDFANIVRNPTARMGNAAWYDAGNITTDYDVGDPDQYTSFGAPNFTATHTGGSGGYGPLFFTNPTASTYGDLSESFAIGASVPITLAAILTVSSWVGGTMGIDVVCYDNSNQVTGVICQTSLGASTPRSLQEASGTTPANTTYARVRKWVDGATATNFIVERIKVNRGNIAAPYSDDIGLGQYLAIRAGRDAAQAVPDSTFTTILFDSVFFDDPGTNRYATGTGRFTADRYMKVRVSAAIVFQDSADWGANERGELWLFKNGVSYALLERHEMQAVATYAMGMNGATLIELQDGDYIEIQAWQDSGVAQNLVADDKWNYLDVEEIT